MEEIIVNERILNITGGISIPDKLENDCEYTIIGKITTYAVGDQRSNQNGTYNIHNKAKVSDELNLVKGETVIKGVPRTKSKMSVALRMEVETFGSTIGAEDTEKFYREQLGKIIERFDDVYYLLNS